jgi:hypothetical protein
MPHAAMWFDKLFAAFAQWKKTEVKLAAVKTTGVESM